MLSSKEARKQASKGNIASKQKSKNGSEQIERASATKKVQQLSKNPCYLETKRERRQSVRVFETKNARKQATKKARKQVSKLQDCLQLRRPGSRASEYQGSKL